MRSKPIVLLTVLVLVFAAMIAVLNAGAEDKPELTAEEAYQEAKSRLMDIDPDAERLAVYKTFLENYPESGRTAGVMGAVVYYQGEKLGDMEGALAFVEGIRSRITDPAIAKEADKALMEIYGDAGNKDKMLALADRFEAESEMQFGDYWKLVGFGVEHEDWSMVRKYCDKARPLATPQAYRGEFPKYEFTDEEAAKAARNREAMLATKDGWAKANTGNLDAALADFALADGFIRKNYIGIPDYELNIHWANTLVMNGDYQAAIDKFAPDALLAGNEDAGAGMKIAYEKLNGSADGFETYCKKIHKSITKVVDDFELPDYDGHRQTFSDLRGDVTMLTFWFPT
jgi:hypothetical protein